MWIKCNSLKKGSPTKITISQLPEILEGSIKAQIEGFDVHYSLIIVLHFYIILHWVSRNLNKHGFAQIRQKRQYNLKTTIFVRSSPKSIGFLRKHIQIIPNLNFKTICATSFELSRDKKYTIHTQVHTRSHTYLHTFSADDFFSM